MSPRFGWQALLGSWRSIVTLRCAPARVVVLILALGTAFSVLFSESRLDDAFITYRYGYNLAHGRGLVFNPGQAVMGSTAPAHVLLAAAVASLAPRESLPLIMACIGCFAWAAQVPLVYALLLPAHGERNLRTRVRALIPALAVATGAGGASHFVSLETHVLLVVLLLAALLASRGRWGGALALGAIATLVRPDAGLAFVLLAAWCFVEQRSRGLVPIAGALVFALLWPILASWMYGSPIPQSAVAKVGRATYGQYLQLEWDLVAAALRPGVFAIFPQFLPWLLLLLGAGALLRQHRRLWLIPALALSYFAAYALLRPFTSHRWHTFPPVLFCVICAYYGLAQTLTQRGILIPTAGALLTVLLLLSSGFRELSHAWSYSDDYWVGARERCYRAAAAWFERRAPTAIVASVEVGTIAYYGDVTMHDWGGLITPRPFYIGASCGRYRYVVIDRENYDLVPNELQASLTLRDGFFEVRIYDLARAANQRYVGCSQLPGARRAL